MASFGGGKKNGLSLNLMPMLDIFSIIITFLLMTFSTDPVNYDIVGLELPQSKTFIALDELPTIKATKTEVYVLEKKVADIGPNGDVLPQYMNQGAVGPVFTELDEIRRKRLALQNVSDPNDQRAGSKKGIVAMEMDKGGSFLLMRRIMLAAQQAEFITFKLIVNKPGS